MTTKHITLSEYRQSKAKDYIDIKSIELGTGFIRKRQINGAIKWFKSHKIEVTLNQRQISIIIGGTND